MSRRLEELRAKRDDATEKVLDQVRMWRFYDRCGDEELAAKYLQQLAGAEDARQAAWDDLIAFISEKTSEERAHEFALHAFESDGGSPNVKREAIDDLLSVFNNARAASGRSLQ